MADGCTITLAVPPEARCCVDGCPSPSRRRGYCGKHYYRLMKHGDPNLTVKTLNGVARAFLEAAKKHVGADCLLWPYYLDDKGYARLTIDGKSRLVHRVICESRHGPPPEPRLDAAHRCNRRACINADHLRWATRASNLADRDDAGTHQKGDRCPTAKLTAEDVRYVRAALGKKSQIALALELGVSKGAINDIARGKTWVILT